MDFLQTQQESMEKYHINVTSLIAYFIEIVKTETRDSHFSAAKIASKMSGSQSVKRAVHALGMRLL